MWTCSTVGLIRSYRCSTCPSSPAEHDRAKPEQANTECTYAPTPIRLATSPKATGNQARAYLSQIEAAESTDFVDSKETN